VASIDFGHCAPCSITRLLRREEPRLNSVRAGRPFPATYIRPNFLARGFGTGTLPFCVGSTTNPLPGRLVGRLFRLHQVSAGFVNRGRFVFRILLSWETTRHQAPCKA
jgi:hypothetical protein